MYQTIKTLTELPGMGGFEQPVNSWLYERWKPYVESLEIEGVGNLVAHVGGTGPKLLIEAHADEIGFLVRSIDEKGYIWISPKNTSLGRPARDTFLVGQPALIQTDTGNAHGVFAAISGHVASPLLRDKAILDWNDVFVDIGVSSADQAMERGIHIGDSVIWNPVTRRLGNLITGKAMDDRAALAIMTELLSRLKKDKLKYNVFFASTVQEEMGLVGAESLERNRAFDFAVALDVGLAGDVPGVQRKDMPIQLGDGPILVHHDMSVHYDRYLTKAISVCAEAAEIPIQHAIFPHYSSDGAALIKLGIPTALLAFATRYTHSPFETLNESDLNQCVVLLQKFLETPFLEENHKK